MPLYEISVAERHPDPPETPTATAWHGREQKLSGNLHPYFWVFKLFGRGFEGWFFSDLDVIFLLKI